MRIISGKYGRRRFDVPSNITARPTTDFAKENIFNVIVNYIDLEDKIVVDLFAGTGAISFEFLSRGCAEVTSVEKSMTQYSFIKKVSELLKCDNHKIIKGDVFKFLKTASSHADIVFADPPYKMPEFDSVIEHIFSSNLVKDNTLVILEHPADKDYSSHDYFRVRRSYGTVNFSIFYKECSFE